MAGPADGEREVFFEYCVSLLFVTLRRPSRLYRVRPGLRALWAGLPYTLLTMLLGWWLIEENEGIGLSQGVDIAGSVLISAALMIGVYAIVTAAGQGWTTCCVVPLSLPGIPFDLLSTASAYVT